jgi:hypothetical protein
VGTGEVGYGWLRAAAAAGLRVLIAAAAELAMGNMGVEHGRTEDRLGQEDLLWQIFLCSVLTLRVDKEAILQFNEFSTVSVTSLISFHLISTDYSICL